MLIHKTRKTQGGVMKILVVGGGGREHALVWKIAQSPRVQDIYCAPGNAGMQGLAECVEIDSEDVSGLLNFAKKKEIDLTVVGPEAPLVAGIVDRFQEAGLKVFGPTKKAAELEGSKDYSKRVMRRHAIPTADFNVFDSLERANGFLDTSKLPIVVKADGLAAGKGVIICHTREEASEAVRVIMQERAFGDAGNRVVIEEFMTGQEASVLMFVDRNTISPMPAAQDHKPIGEGDTGPNTGGMGAYSPTKIVHKRLDAQIEREILIPIVHAMNREDRPYSGVLYAGLMLTNEGAKVLEFNCRFGDPETQPLLMRMKSDIVDILEAVAVQKLEDVPPIEWDDRPAVCVVLASGGYPNSYAKGYPITGLEEANAMEDVVVFHAGTRMRGSNVITSGGRVLGVTALGDTLEHAITRCYEAVGKIHFEGMTFRSDIAAKAL
jgi:phosphoribosylamine--glycine ligase